MREQFYENRDECFEELSRIISNELSRAIHSRGAASLIFSGGSTPKPLYQRLFDVDLPWSRIFSGLSDERWVDIDHPDSNEKMIRGTCKGKPAESMQLTGMRVDEDIHNAAAIVSDLYGVLPRPLDVVLLGMGTDGHTASLFPAADGLSEALNEPRLSTRPVKSPNGWRMSLTQHTLLDTRHVVLLITGEEKRAVYQQAIQSGPIEDMPVRILFQQDQTPVSVFWAP